MNCIQSPRQDRIRRSTVRSNFAILLSACCGIVISIAASADGEERTATKPSASQPDTVEVATIAMHSKLGEPEANLDRVEEWAIKAHRRGATFAVFPEECITGSLNKSSLTRPEAAKIAETASKMARPRLEAICRKLEMTLVVGIIEPSTGDKLSNNALIIGPKGYLATFTKLQLPNENELAWFTVGETLPVVTSQGWIFSVGIGADMHVPEYFRMAARNGAEFMLLPAGGSDGAELVGADGDQKRQAISHKTLHMEFLPERALESGLYIFYANQAGHSGTDWFPGLALAVDPTGQLVDEHLPTEGIIVTEMSRKEMTAARKARKPATITLVSQPVSLKNSSSQPVQIKKIGEP